MKNYSSSEEIEYDLKRLKLERQIGLERLKGLKGEYAESLKPINWVGTALKFGGSIGMFFLLKKLFR